MQRRGNGCSEANAAHTKDKKKWTKPLSILSNKVSTIFSSVFCNKKSPKAYLKAQINDDNDQSDLAEAQILEKAESIDNQPFAVAPKLPLHESHSVKKFLEIEDEEEELKLGTRANKATMADKSLKVSSFLSKLFHIMGSTLNFIKVKINKTNANNNKINKTNTNDSSSCTRGIAGTTNIVLRRQGIPCNQPSMPSFANSVGTKDTVIGRQESSSDLPRVPPKILTTWQKLQMARSLRKMANKQIGGRSEQDDKREREHWGGEELCKKRILMGEKCKPLNFSGTLQYDKDGILLPEVLP